MESWVNSCLAGVEKSSPPNQFSISSSWGRPPLYPDASLKKYAKQIGVNQLRLEIPVYSIWHRESLDDAELFGYIPRSQIVCTGDQVNLSSNLCIVKPGSYTISALS